MLDHGLGTKKDKNQAYFYYKLAADQGLPSAFNNIGVLAFRGEYINKDYDLANRMFKTAADANCSIAMYNYAFMVQNGFSHQINNGLAAHYYKLAADMGDVNAMKAYANLLDKSGEALIQDSITHQPLLNDQNEVMKYRQMASYQNKIQDTIKYQSTYFANYVVNVDHNFFNDLGVDEAQKCVCSIY